MRFPLSGLFSRREAGRLKVSVFVAFRRYFKTFCIFWKEMCHHFLVFVVWLQMFQTEQSEWEKEDEGWTGWMWGERTMFFTDPVMFLSVKTSSVSFTALHSVTPWPQRFMADRNTTPDSYRGQTGVNRSVVSNETYKARCWRLTCSTKRPDLVCFVFLIRIKSPVKSSSPRFRNRIIPLVLNCLHLLSAFFHLLFLLWYK